MLRLPADGSCLAGARRRIRDWLTGHRVPEARIQEMLLAVSEACTNAIEHGYRGPNGRDEPVHCRCEIVPGTGLVEITINDRGTWQPSGEGDGEGDGRGGHGLRVIEAVAQRLSLRTDATGTTLRAWFPLS